jgi:hypothetical protein
MKIRLGFVSNSSSSSFLLKNTTCKEVAISMLGDGEKHSENNWPDGIFNSNKFVDKVNKLTDNQAVTFKVGGFETYIFKYNDFICVDTCNNIYWDDIYRFEYPEFDSLIKDFYDGDYFEDKIFEDIVFYNLDYDVIGFKSYFKTCNKCHENLMIIKGNLMCPNCQNEEMKKMIQDLLLATQEEPIFFWKSSDEYFVFSNFYPSKITINDKEYPTVEHYYQSMKAELEKDREYIRLSENPGEAKKRGRECKIRNDWEKIKIDVMLTALRRKYEVNELKEVLLKTGNRPIFEDSPKDRIWGTGVRGEIGTGQNLLGKALMEIREEIRSKK